MTVLVPAMVNRDFARILENQIKVESCGVVDLPKSIPIQTFSVQVSVAKEELSLSIDQFSEKYSSVCAVKIASEVNEAGTKGLVFVRLPPKKECSHYDVVWSEYVSTRMSFTHAEGCKEFLFSYEVAVIALDPTV